MVRFQSRIAVLIALAWPALGALGQVAGSDDDRHVVAAALASIVEVGTDHPAPGRLLFLSDSIAMCGRISDGRCIMQRFFERFRETPARQLGVNDSAGPRPEEVLPDRSSREALVASAIARNAERHPWRALPNADLVAMTADQEAALSDNENSTKYAGFSLPTYTAGGDALVYGFYRCGRLCGKGWLFYLRKQASGWTVISRYMIWIS